MKFSQYLDKRLDPPIDGAVVPFFKLTHDGTGIVAYRATYHVSTPWADHPWAKDRPQTKGQAFTNEWAIESHYEGESFSSSGRCDGWRGLGPSALAHGLERFMFDTREDALRKVLKLTESRIAQHEERLTNDRAKAAKLREEIAS